MHPVYQSYGQRFSRCETKYFLKMFGKLGFDRDLMVLMVCLENQALREIRYDHKHENAGRRGL